MAELLVEAKVTGLEEVKKLEKAVTGLEKEVSDLGSEATYTKKEIRGFEKEVSALEKTTTKTTSGISKLSGIISGAFLAAMTAVSAVGIKNVNMLREMDGNTKNLSFSITQLIKSFSSLTASILENTRIYDGLNAIVELASASLDKLTVALGGNTLGLSANEQKAGELASQILRLTELHGADNAQVIELTKQYKSLNEQIVLAYEVNVLGISAKDKLVAKQKEENEEIRKSNEAYEKANKIADDFVNKVNAETEAIIAKSQALQEQTQQTERATEATERATEATEKAIKANQTFSSSAGTQSGAESYAQHALGINFVGANDNSERYLREIAEATRDTNDSVRGY